MGKRKKTYSKNSGVSSMRGIKGIAQNGACIVAGLAVGSAINKFIAKKDSVNGTDLLGLDGATSKFSTPIITTALGCVGSMMLKNKMAQMVSLGIASAGGVGLVNSLMGKNVVSLSGDDEMVALPGVAGLGANYDDLPSNNELMTEYQDIQPVGDVDVDVDFQGVGETMSFDESIVEEEVNGVEELL